MFPQGDLDETYTHSPCLSSTVMVDDNTLMSETWMHLDGHYVRQPIPLVCNPISDFLNLSPFSVYALFRIYSLISRNYCVQIRGSSNMRWC